MTELITSQGSGTIEKGKPPTISGPCFIFNNDGHDVMLEEVYNPATEFLGFAIWKDGQTSIVDHYERNGITIMPRLDDGVKKGIIVLPTEPVEFTDVASLIEEIKTFIKKWLDIPADFLEFCAWYVLLTWVHDRLKVLNYLRAMGDFSTGKSRFLDTIGGLCYRAMQASGATTAAAVARLIELWKGTLILNEADWEKSDERQEIVRILNEGFEKQRAVIKAHQDKQRELIYYNVFGPKVMATRQPFDDPALESRCLTTIMEETTRADIPPILTDAFFKGRQTLINKLLMFRFRFWDKVSEEPIEKLFPKLLAKRIERRLIQATITFSVLFANDEKLLNRFLVFLEGYQKELREERAMSFDGLIINAVYQLVMSGDGAVYSQKIAHQMISAGWVGDPPNPRTIGRKLRALKLPTRVEKVGGTTYRTILWDDETMKRAAALVNKYVPEPDKSFIISLVSYVTKGIDCNITLERLFGKDIAGVGNLLVTNETDETTKPKGNETNETDETTVKVEFLGNVPAVMLSDVEKIGPFTMGEIAEIPRRNALGWIHEGLARRLVAKGGAGT